MAFATFKTCLKPSPLTVVFINAAIVPDLTAAKINKRYSIRLSINKAKESGARMAIELNVSGAFHSPLMASAREHLAEVLNSLEISDTIYPVFTNVDSKPVIKSNEIKDSLIRQLENPVHWSRSIMAMKDSGIQSFLEIGPGKVLQGLNKRIDRSLKCSGIESLHQLENFFV